MNAKRLTIILGAIFAAALLVIAGALHTVRYFERRGELLQRESESSQVRPVAGPRATTVPEFSALVKRIEPAGIIVFIEGQAMAAEPGNPERPLGMQSPVFQGERITTGIKSLIRIRFTDGTLLAQGESSSFDIETYLYEAKSPATPAACKLGALKGAFRYLTGAISARNPDKFQALTSRAIIGIRGCEAGALTDPDADLVFAIKLGQNENLVVTSAMLPAATARPLVIKQPGFLAVVRQDGSILQRRYTAEELARLPPLFDTPRSQESAGSPATPSALPAAAGPQPLPPAPAGGEHDYRMVQFPRDLIPAIFSYIQLPHQAPEAGFNIVYNGNLRFRKSPAYIDLTGGEILPSSKAGSSLFNVLTTTTITTTPTTFRKTTGTTGFGI